MCHLNKVLPRTNNQSSKTEMVIFILFSKEGPFMPTQYPNIGKIIGLIGKRPFCYISNDIVFT